MNEPAVHALLQTEMPFALVYGKALTKIPEDLYIPPDALEVFLEAFEGPLDLLLYLIRRQNMDILDIQVAEITRQYMGYIDIMQSMKFELAAEYLVMAAMLGEIKSRCLLPRPRDAQDDEGEDPRAELIRRLQEYERYKQAALDLDALPLEGRDFFVAIAAASVYTREQTPPVVELDELLLALRDVLKRAALYESHHVGHEGLSLRERMADILQALQEDEFLPFAALFREEEGRLGVVVSFIALLELIKEGLLDMVQAESFAPIYIRHRRQRSEELAP